MAQMRPDKPREIQENSMEDIMFEALKQLSDDYYVFHSLKIVTVLKGALVESETDFVIFHPGKGIISIEAKAGHVVYKNDGWYYQSGKRMKGDGPYRQASANKWKLQEYIKEKKMDDLLDSCKFLHAVWFPSIDEEELKTISFPSDADRSITLTSEALDDPEYYISRLFDLKSGTKNTIVTDLQGYQVKRLLESVLCPSFELVPSMKSSMKAERSVYSRMLREQSRILDYLEEQPNAVINGVAGSGKTMLALEKARRCAEKGEQVLFLCYNRFLRDYLNENYKNDNIEFSTIDALSCKICNIRVPNIRMLSEKLEEMFLDGKFPYKHIVIDEGQDFGRNEIDETSLIELFETIVLDDSVEGSFYLFYDKMQLIQGGSIPNYINNADCRLTLYKNCRNTENIAITSMRPFPELKKPKLITGALKGESPNLYIADDAQSVKDYVDYILDIYQMEHITDVVILSCKTENKSALGQYIFDGFYSYNKKKYVFTTCRKFKGLESDVIILVDVDEEVFEDKSINLFYVGASRARFKLEIVGMFDDDSCNKILTKYEKKESRRPKKTLAAFLNAKLVKA